MFNVNSLSTNSHRPTTLKQFIGYCRWIVWVCLNIFWGWRLQGFKNTKTTCWCSTERKWWTYMLLIDTIRWLLTIQCLFIITQCCQYTGYQVLTSCSMQASISVIFHLKVTRVLQILARFCKFPLIVKH